MDKHYYESDIASLSIKMGGNIIHIPNNYGDGAFQVAILDSNEDVDDDYIYVSLATFDDAIVCGDDNCKSEIAKLSGRYLIYRNNFGRFVFKKAHVIEIDDLALTNNPREPLTPFDREGWGNDELWLSKSWGGFDSAIGWFIDGKLVAIYNNTFEKLVFKMSDGNKLVERTYANRPIALSDIYVFEEDGKFFIKYTINNRYGEKHVDELKIN